METGRANMETGRANMETGKEKIETAATKIATRKDKVETGRANNVSAESTNEEQQRPVRSCGNRMQIASAQ